MAPKNKGNKMSLTDFLTNDNYGSWADEMEDMPTIASTGERPTYGSRFNGGGMGDRYSRPGGSDDRFPPRYSRDPVPMPDEPPFTAYVGNLSPDVDEEILGDFFSKGKIESVRIVCDHDGRPKNFGYVEFTDRASLEEAMTLNGAELEGRTLRVNVADPPRERDDGEDRTAGDWRSSRPAPVFEDRPPRRERYGEREDGPPRDFDNWERRGPPPSAGGEDRPRRRRDYERGEDEAPRAFDNWRSGSTFKPREEGANGERKVPERRKLELKPRSAPIEAVPASATYTKASPFGGAAPVDTLKRQQEVERRQAERERERAERVAERAAERANRSAAPAADDIADKIAARRAAAAPARTRTATPVDGNKEDVSVAVAAKQFELLRTGPATDDFVPDEEEDDDKADKPAAADDVTVVEVEEAPSADGEDGWSVVSKKK
ncbi:uncharacterized protein V1510DRAFT_415786 [Dipodascopsis tothii]|uniref:uncharacterized protein n=1 Tax=Dipodascopsis tothii TaxID=44089 RepID=UPI0034CFBBF9